MTHENPDTANSRAEIFALWNVPTHPPLPDHTITVFTRMLAFGLFIEEQSSLKFVVGSITSTNMLIESIFLVLSWMQMGGKNGYEINIESGTLVTESWLCEHFRTYLTEKVFIFDVEKRSYLMKAMISLVFRKGDPQKGIDVSVVAARIHREITHCADFSLFLSEFHNMVDLCRKRAPPALPPPTAFARKMLLNLSMITQEFMLARHPEVYMMSLLPSCLGPRDYENKISIADAYLYETEMCCFVVEADTAPKNGVIDVDVLAFAIDPRCLLTSDAMEKVERGITQIMRDVIDGYITNVLGHAMDGYLLKHSCDVYYKNQWPKGSYLDERTFLLHRAATPNLISQSDPGVPSMSTVRERSRNIIEAIAGKNGMAEKKKPARKKKDIDVPGKTMTPEEFAAAESAAKEAEKELFAMLALDDGKNPPVATEKKKKKKKSKQCQIKKPEEVVVPPEDAEARTAVLSMSENRKVLENAPSPKVYRERLVQMISQYKESIQVETFDEVVPPPIDLDEDCIAFTRVSMLRDQFHDGDKLGGAVDEAFVYDMCEFSADDMMILDVLRCQLSMTPQESSDRRDQNLEHLVSYVASMQDIETLRKYIIFREAHADVFDYLLDNTDPEPLINFLFSC